MRPSGRKTDQMRAVSFERNFSKHAEGSCLVKFGDTHVLCTASLEERVPPWLRNAGKGWVTAEYGMLPRATGDRISPPRSEYRIDHSITVSGYETRRWTGRCKSDALVPVGC